MNQATKKPQKVFKCPLIFLLHKKFPVFVKLHNIILIQYIFKTGILKAYEDQELIDRSSCS